MNIKKTLRFFLLAFAVSLLFTLTALAASAADHYVVLDENETEVGRAETLQSAFTLCTADGYTIRLLDNVTEPNNSATVNAWPTTELIIDGDGNNLTFSSWGVFLQKPIRTVFKNLTIGSNASLGEKLFHLGNSSAGGLLTFSNVTLFGNIHAAGADILIKSGSYQSSHDYGIFDINDNAKFSKITIEDGTFVYSGSKSCLKVATLSSGTSAGAEADADRAILRISGGSFTGGPQGVIDFDGYPDQNGRLTKYNIVIEGGTFTNLGEGGNACIFRIRNRSFGSKVIIRDGNFVHGKGGRGVFNAAGATIEVSGGEFTSAVGVFNCTDGDCVSPVTVNGGVFRATGTGSVLRMVAANNGRDVEKQGHTILSGGEFYSENGPIVLYTTAYSGASLGITGGTFAPGGIQPAISNTAAGTFSLTGGKFRGIIGAEPDSGYGVAKNGEEEEIVSLETLGYYQVLAANGESSGYYKTPQQALAAVTAGGTVRLLADDTLSSSLVFSRDFTYFFDGNGHSLTFASGKYIQIVGTGRITLRNLTVEVGAADRLSARWLFLDTASQEAKLTIEGGNYYGYFLGNGATVHIKSGNFFGNGEHGLIDIGGPVTVSRVVIDGGNFNYTGTEQSSVSKSIIYVRNTSGRSYDAAAGSDGCEILVINGGTFVGGIDGKIEIFSSRYTVRINGGTFNSVGSEKTRCVIRLRNASKGGKLYITGGTFTQTYYKSDRRAIINAAGSTVYISGGTFTSDYCAIGMTDYECLSDVYVSGGTFIGGTLDEDENLIPGFADFMDSNGRGKLEITGGRFPRSVLRYMPVGYTTFTDAKGFVCVKPVTTGIRSASISLGSSILVQYHVDLAPEDFGAVMCFNMAGKTLTVTGVQSDREWIFTFPLVTPQCMTDTITAVLQKNGAALDTVPDFTVRGYCDQLLAKTVADGYTGKQLTAMKRLVVDLLTYGAEAQKYAGHHVETPADENLGLYAPTPYEKATDDCRSVYNTGKVTFTSALLRLDSQIQVRFNFTAANTTGLVLKIRIGTGEERVLSYSATENGYTALSEPLSIADVSTPLTVTAYENGTAGSTVTYSVRSYIAAMQESNDPATALIRDLYTYSLSATAYNAAMGTFTPVLRIAVTSDIHLCYPEAGVPNAAGSTNSFSDVAYDRVAKMMAAIKAHADSTSYTGLDALLVAGDFSDDGNFNNQYNGTSREDPNQMQSVVNLLKRELNSNGLDAAKLMLVMGNHEYYLGEKHNPGNPSAALAEAQSNFMSIVNSLLASDVSSAYNNIGDVHYKIGSYHFIGLSPDINRCNQFSQSKADWLEAELLKVKAEADYDPERPIFVFQHIGIAGTMYGYESNTTSNLCLKKVLDQWPQVVNFSGHTHANLDDPRAIDQFNFTALETCTLRYYGTTGGSPTNTVGGLFGGGMDGITEQGEMNGAMFYIVEVGAQNQMLVYRYDILSSQFIGDPLLIDSIGRKELFTFNDDRSYFSGELEYSAEDQLSPRVISANYALFDIPKPEGDDYLQRFCCDLYEGSGNSLSYRYRIWRLAGTNRYDLPYEVTLPLGNLKAGTTYTVKVYAYTCWGRGSRSPLVYTFTTAPASGTLTPDIFSLSVSGSTVKNAVNGETLQKYATATAGSSKLTFTGAGNYQYNLKDEFEYLYRSYTLETVFTLSELPANGKTVVPVGTYETGGFALRVIGNGSNSANLHFAMINSDRSVSEVSVSSAIKAGTTYHVTATYDGANMKLYLNGTLVDTVAETRVMILPNIYAFNLTIGSDANWDRQYMETGLLENAYKRGTGELYMKGTVSVVNLYSRALTQSEVTSSYQAHKD